ncbi:MAG: hybrid sensor histidine kinase/response regulator, partial [Elainella sp. Prado103]|nr:hybrid sensor histidine kinase/response regulator [Elainella sp. Prado103]
ATVIIALTANAFQEDQVAALESGCDAYIAKPFAETTLFDKLSRYLGLRYIYAEEIPSGKLPEESLRQLTPQDLQVMPAAWIADLQQAAQMIDDIRLQELIEQIPEQNSQLIDGLKRLVNDFQFETIFQLTQS